MSDYKTIVCKQCEAIEIIKKESDSVICSLCIKKLDGLKKKYICENGHITTMSVHEKKTYCSTCRSNKLTFIY